MTSREKAKGSRVERQIAEKLTQAGFPARRVPLSGAHPELPGDVEIKSLGFVGEVKARKNGAGFTTIENWLGDKDFLVLKRNHREPMVVVKWELFIKLLEKEKNEIS